MSSVNIDWNSIQPLNGSRASGFEELCSQLARAESPTGSRFERKGTPDAGVECYVVLSSGEEWAWQAKYFDTLGDSQWSQLDDSVENALSKHPRIVRYFVCVPLDRPDARLPKQRSAKDRWDDRVKKWTQSAKTRGQIVEFLYWGSSELLELLASPKNAGRVHFWFGICRFDNTWFAARLDEAIKTAGPRYTPEIHVKLPIAREFEGFGRTEQFFDEIKANARNIRKKSRQFFHAESELKSADPALAPSMLELTRTVDAVLSQLQKVEVQPVGVLPFLSIANLVSLAEDAAANVEGLLLEHERADDATDVSTANPSARRSDNRFRTSRYSLASLADQLHRTREALLHGQDLGQSLMLLSGSAGTGKTHLLCDVSQRRLAAGRPTVLLMGQRFVSNEAPWTQVLQQLDLPGLSAEDFSGAIEAAAQAANSRALVIIDAINEGTGRTIWPTNLAAFIALLERSPWIGVLLSVRTSYQDIVVPSEIRARVISVTHDGFSDNEYDAARTFFAHYQLELPSTPLLTPEFRNPLFLKTLCHGLSGKGERRLPRGFHGIRAVFDLYVDTINDRVATAIDFNAKDRLVHRALEEFAKAMVRTSKRWLTRPDAETVINGLLPGRNHKDSLYFALLTEGFLVEEVIRYDSSQPAEMVFIAYERFADHIVTKSLLDTHLNPAEVASSFSAESSLAFIWDDDAFVTPGLLEAMSIQIPELTGRELPAIAPKIMDRWGFGDAFRQSLIWRLPSAFSDETRQALRELERSKHDHTDTLDVLLTVAILPEHPLNANFLHRRLRRDSISDRDAWWSIYLQYAFGRRSAVDRLIDWAYAVTPSMAIDSDALDLCATTLCWMLTSSNRFLRDRATQSTVSLLTGRLDAVIRVVERFKDVNDPYVLERVYAVAYGAATRSYDSTAVGELAAVVYARVFANLTPPAHILLRDYARGVIERALYLGSKIEVIIEQIRPPYKSQWPKIPTEGEIKPLLPDWSVGAHDSRQLEWSRNIISSSVMDGDFARYVIGTNSWTTDWLSLLLNEPQWQSASARLAKLQSEFSEKERVVWEIYEKANSLVDELSPFVVRWLRQQDDNSNEDETENDSDELVRAEQELTQALNAARSALTEEHARQFDAILIAQNSPEGDRAPRFDLKLIQRYVIWRAFDLGWTVERFGYFDRFSRGDHGRESHKAERIGKKYQWIAYQEILAFISDHFQYREQFRDSELRYEGPWQDHLRDIDPTCTLRSVRGGTSWDGHIPSWWAPIEFHNWQDPIDPAQWVRRCDDLPPIDDLLCILQPGTSTKWLNLQGYFSWKQKTPADQESTDAERREVWYSCTGYLISATDADAFLTWAETVHFWGRWMPEPPEIHRMFLGEHAWSAASRYFQQDDGWTQPRYDCPVKVKAATVEYLRESAGFDCSVDDSYTLRLPTSELMRGLGLRWKAPGADYIDAIGQCAVFDPTVHEDGPNALLARQDLLTDFLDREGLAICWTILGEKRFLGAGFMSEEHESVEISGAYLLRNDKPVGFLKCIVNDVPLNTPGTSPTLLATIRSKP